jgi:hypothetical protein
MDDVTDLTYYARQRPKGDNMDRDDFESVNWWWLGVQFGFGFCLAAATFTAIGAFISYEIAKYQISVTMANFNQAIHSIPPPPLSSMPASSPTPAPAPHIPTRHLVRVEPQDKATCLTRSNNVIDDSYKNCITGYSYWVTD